MPADKEGDDIAENIKILATDDEQLKSFGQMFANDSARKILQLLFNEELTAAQISLKTGISLQLAKYHIQKLQELGIVRVTKISKNSKSHDMKHYAVKSFSVVVVPPTLSEKTRSSRLLVHSFRHIYKVAGFGIAAGISGMFSVLQLQGSRPVRDFTSASPPAGNLDAGGAAESWAGTESSLHTTPQDSQQQDVWQEGSQQQQQQHQDMPQATLDDGATMDAGDAPQEKVATADILDGEPATGDAPVAEESPHVADQSSDAPEPPVSPGVRDGLPDGDMGSIEIMSDAVSPFQLPPPAPFPELFFPLVAITAVLGGLTVFYLVKYLKG